MTAPTEPELVDRARSGDRAAFEQLYRGAASRVYALCLRMTGDRAELESVSGTIRCVLDEVAGPVDAETVSGTVRLEAR